MVDVVEGVLEEALLGNVTRDIFKDESDEDKTLFNDADDNWIKDDPDWGDDMPKPSSCKRILYETVGDHTRVWDLLILIPNLVFLAFLLVRFRRCRRRLQETNAPVMAAFHALVLVSTAVSVARSVIAIVSCNASGHAAFNGQAADKVLWVVLRAFLLATEISVLAFALLSGHLDSRASIRRVVLIASSASFVFSAIQMGLEFGHPDNAFKISDEQWLFGHGGRVFWSLSSTLFALVYGSVLVLPLVPCRNWIMMPHRRSFYYYAAFLFVLNVIQAVGAGMSESRSDAVNNPGLCFVNMTTYVYFVAFPPIVYFAFLAQFFGSKFVQPTMLFSYKVQNDEVEDLQSSFTLQASSGNLEEDDMFAQEHNSPIIINGAGSTNNLTESNGVSNDP